MRCCLLSQPAFPRAILFYSFIAFRLDYVLLLPDASVGSVTRHSSLCHDQRLVRSNVRIVVASDADAYKNPACRG
jgi:hypothetical protein